ncbi:MAG: carboxypeptidase regulatory-like domain-containing protein [Planctomycetaceae bacterium]|nr:carboxypeptidase regulatory-like domain-containing protein [Planctomycetaceae bacterium]
MNTLFPILFTATWQSMVLALGVLLIVLLFRERLAPRFRYLLWCVVLLRLALPVLPVSPWGVLPNQGYADPGRNREIAQEPSQSYDYGSAYDGDPDFGGHRAVPPVFNLNRNGNGAVATDDAVSLLRPLDNSRGSDWDGSEWDISEQDGSDWGGSDWSGSQWAASVKIALLTVWLSGMIVFGIRYVNDEIRLFRQSRYWKPVRDANLLAVFESCRKQLGIRRRVTLLAVSHGVGAASTGTIFPKVLLAEQAISHSDIRQLRMVILHELVHLRRFDPLVLRMTVILSVIHWLNPAVWLAMSQLQCDRESACDEAVLHTLSLNHSKPVISRRDTGSDELSAAGGASGHPLLATRHFEFSAGDDNNHWENDPLEGTRKEYGDAVLTFATRFSPRGRMPGMVGLFQKHAIARRIEMILKYKKSNLLYALLGVLLVTAVAAFGLTRAANPVKALLEALPAMTNQAGVKVHGHVTDANGKPVEGALLVWQTEPNDYWDNREKAVTTDQDGFYESPELKAMPGSITVIAEGFAPDMKQVEFRKNMKPVDFTLKPGKTLEIRFVDKDGNPVPGVKLTMGGNPDPWWRKDSNIYNKSFYCEEAMEKGILADPKIPYAADENGVYRWTWAPEDRVRFIFSGEGYLRIFTDAYEPKPNNWFVADEGPYQIVMHPKLTVTGTVLDDETGQAVSNFKVVPGNIRKNYFPGGIIWQTGQANDFTDGQFEYSIDSAHDEGYRIRIDADGFESYTSDDMQLGEVKRNFNIRLKKYGGLAGTVLLPDNSPAADTKIYVSGSGVYLQVTNPPNSDLLHESTGRLTTTADQDGKFTIYQKPDDQFGMYFEHPQGLTWVNSNEFQQNNEIRLHGFAEKLTVILPSQYISEREARFTLWTQFTGNGFGHVDYQKTISPKEKQYDFDNIVAGKHKLTIWERSPLHEWVRGSTAFESFSVSFEIKEGETKTLNFDIDGTQVTGKIQLPDLLTEPLTERDWAYNRIELTRKSEEGELPSKLAVTLKKSETGPQTGTFQFDRVPPGEYGVSASIFKSPEDSTSMNAELDTHPIQLVGHLVVPEGVQTIEMPALVRLISLWNEDDALIFTDGEWKNEATSEVIPDGSIVQGTRGTFRLEQENGEGKVIKLAGDGATGQAKYVRLSDGGNAIVVSQLSFELLKELKEHGMEIGMDDVFVYDDSGWKNEKTGDVVPVGTLVAGTRGLFRLEQENGEGKVTLLNGGGATGHGSAIRWSHGGNAISIGKP